MLVRGYWYWLLKDGTLIGGTDDVNTGLWNHFETMCRMLGVDHRRRQVISQLHPLYKNGVMWTRYRALRVSIATTHCEVNVQVYGRPTSAQIEALRTLYYRNNQRLTWDLGIEYRKELTGTGSFADFQIAFERQFGASSR